MRKIKGTDCGRIGWLLVSIFFLAAIVTARPMRPSLLQLTRSAPVVVVAQIESVGEGLLTAKTRRVIKGSQVPKRMSLNVNYPESEGGAACPISLPDVGETVVIFAKPQADRYEAVFDGSGIVSSAQFHNSSQNLKGYEDAIGRLVEYDSATSSQDRAALLLSMLEDGYFNQESATQIIYLEITPQKYPTEGLVTPLLNLARDARNTLQVPAIQALSRIGGKPVIPELIQLLDSENIYARETVANVLKDKTRVDLGFDPSAPEDQRAEQVKKWLQWWNENKDRVQLHH
jgi:hypothetical protein